MARDGHPEPMGVAFGFLGLNGAGKSTTISILCTLLTPNSGGASVTGFDVTRDPLAVRRRIGLVFQAPTVDEPAEAIAELHDRYDVFMAYTGGTIRDAEASPRLRQTLVGLIKG